MQLQVHAGARPLVHLAAVSDVGLAIPMRTSKVAQATMRSALCRSTGMPQLPRPRWHLGRDRAATAAAAHQYCTSAPASLSPRSAAAGLEHEQMPVVPAPAQAGPQHGDAHKPPPQRRSPVYYLILVGGALLPIGYTYYTHQEPVLVTGRTRVTLLDADLEKHLGRHALAGIDMAKRLPESDPRVKAVKAVGQRIITAAIQLQQEEAAAKAAAATAAGTANGSSRVSHAAVPADPREWRFFVVDSPMNNALCAPGGPMKNALCAPGGTVVVFSGMMKAIDDSVRKGQANGAGGYKYSREDALATLLSHEIGHALARHGAEKCSVLPIMSVLQLLAGVSVVRMWILQLLVARPFSRLMEREADEIGMNLMARACYNLDAAPAFYASMNSNSTHKALEWLSTHPADAERAIATEQAAMRLKGQQGRWCPACAGSSSGGGA